MLDLVGLGDRPDMRVSALSGGQRRRLDLALGIAGDPELVFLDEPTTGFDPSARRQSWELISALRDLGKTILLTTHYMDEAQHLADRVVVIARGNVIAEGTPDSARSRRRPRRRSSRFRIPYGVAADELPLARGRRGRAPRAPRLLPHAHPDPRPRSAAEPGPRRTTSSSRR